MDLIVNKLAIKTPTIELIETIRDISNVIKKLINVPKATIGFRINKTPKLEATDLPPVKFRNIDLLWPSITELPPKISNQGFHVGLRISDVILEIISYVIRTPVIAFNISNTKTTMAAFLPTFLNILVAPVDPEP